MTADDPAWPGMSTSTTSWSEARSSANVPHARPVWLKPWASTTLRPGPAAPGPEPDVVVVAAPAAPAGSGTPVAPVTSTASASPWSGPGAGSDLTLVDIPDERTDGRGPDRGCAGVDGTTPADPGHPVPHSAPCRRPTRPRSWTSGSEEGSGWRWCARGRGRPPWPSPVPATRVSRCTCAWTSGRPGSRPWGRPGLGPSGLVVTTSGTAAAELHPAVVEADLSAVPLLVCTADRPPELLDVGAPQTITQSACTARRPVGRRPGGARCRTRPSWRSLAARARRRGDDRPRRSRSRPPQPAVPGSAGGRGPVAADPGRAEGAPWHRLDPGRAACPRPWCLEPAAGGRPSAGSSWPVPVVAIRPTWSPWPERSAGRYWPSPDRGCATADREWSRPPRPSSGPGPSPRPAPEIVLRLGESWASRVVGDWLSGRPPTGPPPCAVDRGVSGATRRGGGAPLTDGAAHGPVLPGA